MNAREWQQHEKHRGAALRSTYQRERERWAKRHKASDDVIEEARQLFNEQSEAGTTKTIRSPKTRKRTIGEVAREIMEAHGVVRIDKNETALLDEIAAATNTSATVDATKLRKARDMVLNQIGKSSHFSRHAYGTQKVYYRLRKGGPAGRGDT